MATAVMLSLRLGDPEAALAQFACAEALQPLKEDKALAAFYQAHALSQLGRFAEIIPILDRAVSLSPEVKEYYNLRGVARFKAGDYHTAAIDFERFAFVLNSSHALDAKVKELGYTLNDDELKIVFDAVKQLADRKQRILDEDIEALILEKVLRRPDQFALEHLSVHCGNVELAPMPPVRTMSLWDASARTIPSTTACICGSWRTISARARP